MTLPTQAVLRTLTEHPTREFYGLEICAAAGLPSGTIHPILARLESLGWLASRWEEVDPQQAGRPRRRYYSLTTDGAMQARRALAQVDARAAKLNALRPRFSAGRS
jgi:DNA-binding PadR family transcriptional regulator